MFREFIQLLYPHLCVSCNQTLVQTERYLCVECLMKLPETHDHLQKENGVEKSLWGRIPFERAFSFLFFNQAGITQKLLHELKYRGNEDLAVFLGEYYAKKIQKTVENHGIDAIVAVPLHKSKLRKRGYNQSFAFSRGLSDQLLLENLSDWVERTVATETQTKKSRQERWANVEDIFRVKEPERFTGKHILLVDDVITTGATVESLANAIVKKCKCLISVASIAFAA